MSERLTPTMRTALRSLYAGRRLLWNPREVPGGASTLRALISRGLVERSGQHYCLTDRGIETARDELGMPA